MSLLNSIWGFAAPLLKPVWSYAFKFVPFLASWAFGRKGGIDKQKAEQMQKTIKTQKVADEIQKRPLLGAADVRKRLHKNTKS